MALMARNGLMAGDRYEEITATAIDLVEQGRGRQLMLVPGWWYVISAQTYIEFLKDCPDVVEFASQIPCDTLFIRSAEEPADLYPAEEIAERSPHPVDIEILDAGGHYYVGGEQLVTDSVARWLSARLSN